jgi:hypothetical protein
MELPMPSRLAAALTTLIVAGVVGGALLSLPGPARAAPAQDHCGTRFTVELVHLLLVTAEQAYVEMTDDPGPFGQAVIAVRVASGCLQEAADPALAARIHRLMGLHRMVNGDDDEARRAFAAARALEPDFRFPDTIQPADPAEPFNLVTFGMPATPTPRAQVPPLARGAGALWFDGAAGQARPADRPTLAQHVDAEGGVVRTAYLRMDQPMFDYPVQQVKDRSAAWWTGGVGVGALGVAAGAGVYYAVVMNRGGCEATGDAYTCSAISTSTEEFDQTFVRPTKVVGFTALGLGSALVVTSGVLFAVDPTGATVGLHRRW